MYRKPSWVTHMEELQAALKGNKEKLLELSELSESTSSMLNVKHEEVLVCENLEQSDDTQQSLELNTSEVDFDSFLSPIEEYTEPSSGSSTRHSSSNSDDVILSKVIYNSCNTSFPASSWKMSTKTEKYQTFPRRKQDRKDFEDGRYFQHKNKNKHTTTQNVNKFDEPRELDPSDFHQLHTVDSDDELQEFLLLESACMTDIKTKGGIGCPSNNKKKVKTCTKKMSGLSKR